MEKYTFFTQKDLVVILPYGDIKSRSYPKLERKIIRELKPNIKLIINMENIKFLDSHGIVFLLRVREIVQSYEGYFAIYNLSNHITTIIKRLQLENILNIASSPENCFINASRFETANRMTISV